MHSPPPQALFTPHLQHSPPHAPLPPGNLLFFACYGVVAHSLPWNHYACGAAPRGLPELQANHRRLHPDGRAAPRTLFNRCHEKLKAPLDELMHYCWAPALAAAEAAQAASAALAAGSVALGTRGTGEAAARLNHTWAEVVRQLEAMRATKAPLFRFV